MAFHYLWRVLDYRRDPREDIAHNRHADKGRNGHANFHGVNIGMVADNDAGFFHALYALHHGRRRQAYAAPQFSVREPTIDLQLMQELPANLVE